MKPLYRCVFVLVLMLFTQINIASEQALSAVPVPPDANVQPVSINLLQNGHMLSIAHLETPATIESTLQFYREQWQEPLAENIPGFVEELAGEWSIISRPYDGWNQVVQLRQGSSGVEGRVSVMHLEPSVNALPPVPMPGGASLVSSTGAQDIGHSSNTYVVFSKSGVRSVSDFYRNHFDDEGWSRVSDRLVDSSQVMLLQRAGERAEVVISRVSTGGTLTLINKVIDNG